MNRGEFLAALGVLVVIAAVGVWQLRSTSVPAEPSVASPPKGEFARFPVGRAAPDFELKEIGGARAIRLSALCGRPTVLAFGSFSCDLFCSQTKQLVALHSELGGQANFLFVYIREAGHGNPDLDAHLREKPRDRIAAGLELYKIGFPCVDGRESEIVREYHGWPERLYLLDDTGVVVWESSVGIGTEGMRLPEAEAKLRSMLMRQ